ncbi:hypothetical protein EYB25_003777 [Talaromyces marneffei]|uniref:uncharacterized protein n=1 Tax=Talaromyces marneffei TaxID=37727 RepID=UPI0012A96B88|nr:uncharacterized protein EYB26_006253 [Talaromyces marneffei]KAE8555229.1 hypothetical protein EYB25_003777 [Talaromyces marneffei]QGA18568.1 hypothetical protein EYB26_006253 [Talaromyces marneffei]
MAQNAYSSEINNSSIVGRDEKGIHYRDDTDTISGSDKRKRNKAEENEEEKLPFYPAFCFPASPTHFTWVKMSIADIHRLQSRRGFEGQNIYFHKNHPIQFVCLAGYILSRDEYDRRTVLTVDDSSGSVIEVTCLKAPIKDATDTTIPTPTALTNAMEVEMTNVTSTTRTPIDITTLHIGTCVKLKGTLSSQKFRSTPPIMQVILERFWHLPDTNSEVRFWNERSRCLIDVLSQPWRLSAHEVEELRKQAQLQERKVIRDRQRKQERQKRVQEREEKHQRRIWRRWEAEEKVRKAEDERVRLDNKRLEKWLALKREEKPKK